MAELNTCNFTAVAQDDDLFATKNQSQVNFVTLKMILCSPLSEKEQSAYLA